MAVARAPWLADARPYPWPYDGGIDPRRLALVIAGDQAAWVARSTGAQAVAAVIDSVARSVRDVGGLVVHVRHAGWPSPSRLPPTRVDAGWALATPVAAVDVVADAAGVDGFYGGALDQILRRDGRDTLVFCGFGAEATVNSTLRSANDRGFESVTLADGCAWFDPVTGRHTLHSITMSGGIFGATAASADLLTALDSLITAEARS